MAKLAPQADLWYNEDLNTVVAGSACDTPARIHLQGDVSMTTLPPHANNGNPSPKHTYTIYALIDPRDNRIRYVGCTYNLTLRLSQHLQCHGLNPAKDAWIQELKKEHLVPIMRGLERVKAKTLAEATETENQWIKYYSQPSNDLLNMRIGVEYPIDNRKSVTYEFQYRKCNRVLCGSCRDDQGHGPYWYAYQRGTDGKLHSYYIGKHRPPDSKQVDE